MNADIKITVLVTIYNVEYYLRKCIESILCQSYRNIEVILVDDGSTDGCSDICDHYVEIDNRIKVIHKQNGGVVSARKAGTAASTGDYILSVDGDDWIEKDRIEMLVVEGIIPCKPDMVCLSGYRKDFEEESVLIDSEIPKRVFYKKEIRKQVFSLLDIKKFFEPVMRIHCGHGQSNVSYYKKNRHLLMRKLCLVKMCYAVGAAFWQQSQ